MLAEVRKANPSVYMYTSSNGMVMSDELIESLVENRIDRILFSIDGATQKSYETYRKKGNLKRVLENIDRLNRVKERYDSDKPILHWRYILFKWNDSWREMKKAVSLAERHHFNEFTWEITGEPPGAGSPRFVPGTSGYARIERDIFNGTPQRNALLHKDVYKGYLFPKLKGFFPFK